jgi:hypothetical protein
VTPQAIVRYTEEVAADIARAFPNAPFDELRVWLRIAHQREAMVTQLYDLSGIEARLGDGDTGSAASVARAVVGSIWAHEESHTHFLGSVRSISESFSGLAEMQGKLEGVITRSASSGGLLARMLIAVGASLQRVPDFARDLKRMSLRDLVEFHGELETTARMGYGRIFELERRLEGDEDAQDAFGYTFGYDVVKILCEEAFHEDTFREMATWLTPDGSAFAPLARAHCVGALHGLAERHLSTSNVRRLAATPAGLVPKGIPPGEGWVSDGGLGNLFASFHLAVPVVRGATL